MGKINRNLDLVFEKSTKLSCDGLYSFFHNVENSERRGAFMNHTCIERMVIAVYIFWYHQPENESQS